MQEASAIAEAEAGAAPRALVAVGEVERWIAEQPWEPIPGGWRVRERFQCWRFRLERVAGGFRIIMAARGGEQAEWNVLNLLERRT